MALNLDNLKKKNEWYGANRVSLLYSSIIMEKYNRRMYARITTGGKMEKTAKAFSDLAQQRGISLRELLTQAIEMYGIDFCMKTFRTPYPQINVVLSEKMLAKIRVHNKVPLKVAKEDISETVQTYLDVMKDVDTKSAIECVEGGWPEGMPEVRKRLIQELKKRKT